MGKIELLLGKFIFRLARLIDNFNRSKVTKLAAPLRDNRSRRWFSLLSELLHRKDLKHVFTHIPQAQTGRHPDCIVHLLGSMLYKTDRLGESASVMPSVREWGVDNWQELRDLIDNEFGDQDQDDFIFTTLSKDEYKHKLSELGVSFVDLVEESKAYSNNSVFAFMEN